MNNRGQPEVQLGAHQPKLPALAALPSLWLALRYLRARSDNRFLSLTSALSIGGMVLGVAVLTLVMAVMNGFDQELRSRILGMVPMVLVEGPDPAQLQPLVAAALAATDAGDLVIGAAPYWEGQGMLSANGSTRVVAVQGVDPRLHGSVAIVDQHMRQGSFADLAAHDSGIILGEPLRYSLGLLPGDPVALLVPRPAGSGVVPEILRLTLVGSFEVDAEVDYSLALVPLARLQAAGLAKAGRLGLRLATRDPHDAPLVAQTLRQALANNPSVSGVADWSRDWGELFQAVAMEKMMMFILLALILAIAGFNIVATLAMLVQEKQPDIAMLRTLGLTPRRAARAFLLQGVLVGLLGVAGGLLLGLLLAWNISAIVAGLESLIGGSVLGGTYFNTVPSQVEWPDLVLIALLTVATAVLAALRPAAQASRISPVEALHGA